MATTMTHLDGNYRWLQFRAAMWPSVPLTLFFGIMLLVSTTVLERALSVFVPVLATPMLFFSCIPDPDAMVAFGFNRARARRVAAPAAVISALVPSAIVLVTQPNWAGATGAVLATVASAILFAASLPDGEKAPSSAGAREGEGKGTSALARARELPTSSTFALFWRRNLLWGVGTGVAMGVLVPLSRHIEPEMLRGFVAAIMVLVLWMRICFGEENRAITWRSLGLTRKRWALTALGNVVAANVLFGAGAIAVAALIDATIPTTPLLMTTMLGIGACMLGLAGTTRSGGLSFVAPIAVWIPMRAVWDVSVFSEGATNWMPPLVMTAVVAVPALIIGGLYVAGTWTGRKRDATSALGMT